MAENLAVASGSSALSAADVLSLAAEPPDGPHMILFVNIVMVWVDKLF